MITPEKEKEYLEQLKAMHEDYHNYCKIHVRNTCKDCRWEGKNCPDGAINRAIYAIAEGRKE
jgi:hypothetical protein